MDRQLFGGHTDSLNTLSADLGRVPKHFVLLLAADTRLMPGPELVEAAEGAVNAGASYVCCWGPDCSRFHDAFDEADLFLNGESSDQRLLMTTWHDTEPLEEALWFAAWAAFPSPYYQDSTHAVVAVAIGNSAWASEIDTYWTAGVPLKDEA